MQSDYLLLLIQSSLSNSAETKSAFSRTARAIRYRGTGELALFRYERKREIISGLFLSYGRLLLASQAANDYNSEVAFENKNKNKNKNHPSANLADDP